ncbi:putative membrane protein YdjX (TVP38/TMEM64 family) [Hydrogenispora ethanolica]|uniref:TVP38/TMEM64 family membrane protein n=1 Tax=Hydrogenispora ethanolica TaxID=1082276 RepID=A0A4R1QSZ0_HYDET|nr:TVP38/TMEM64 family protein [Hydrogenispora ethanolica]TCL56161.1 putative membrane protein YdjX (TVP38/TMEM64 family) [Hydrogenispora ethanolica]
MERQQKILIFLNSVLLTVFAILIIYLTIRYGAEFTALFRKPRQFRELLTAYGPISVLVFIFFQIVQVVVATIPGELIQIAGGYVYGTFLGTVYSTLGILCGTVAAFYIARLLGYRLLRILLPQQELAKFEFLMNKPKAELTMFLLFLIPGIPKDILTYLAGITPIKPSKFFLTVTLARFPGILASSFVGSHIQQQRYLPVIIVSVIACLLFLVGFLKKDSIIQWLHRHFHAKEPRNSDELELKQTQPEEGR